MHIVAVICRKAEENEAKSTQQEPHCLNLNPRSNLMGPGAWGVGWSPAPQVLPGHMKSKSVSHFTVPGPWSVCSPVSCALRVIK
jgi:hypothetical protein